MLKVRVIPVLLLKGGRMVKGRRFTDFRDVGDPISAARIYNAQNADELIFLDIEASKEGRSTFLDVIESVSQECFMPLTVGGGIRSIEDVRTALRSGADKVVINTAALERPSFICEAATAFGSQCVVVGVDVRRAGDRYHVYSHSGRVAQDVDFAAHLRRVAELGAGEVFVNSIDRDGIMQGYDLDLLRFARQATDLPLIVCGGAGNFQHLAEAFLGGADAAACSSVFHFGDNNPIRARSFLKNKGLPVKTV